MSHLENSWEEQLLEQQDHLEKEMEEAKKMISGLQVRDFLFSQISPTYFFFFFPTKSIWQIGYLAAETLAWNLTAE